MARRGHPVSTDTRAKIAAALRGKKHPHKGHAMSAETRAKISAALKAKHSATTARGKAGKGPKRAKASSTPSARGSGLRRGGNSSVIAPGGGRMMSGSHGHHARKSAFSLISTGAGYHHSYAGRLRKGRAKRSTKPRFIRTRRAHRVRPRRR